MPEPCDDIVTKRSQLFEAGLAETVDKSNLNQTPIYLVYVHLASFFRNILIKLFNEYIELFDIVDLSVV